MKKLFSILFSIALAAAPAFAQTVRLPGSTSLPATCTRGDEYHKTDGAAGEKIYLCTATNTWEKQGGSAPLYPAPFTAPVNGDFSWVNQGGASVDTSKGGIALFAPAGPGDNVRARVKTAPATPYHIEVFAVAHIRAVSFPAVGIAFRESGTGKIAIHGWTGDASGHFSRYKFNSATSFNSSNDFGNWWTHWFNLTGLWLRIGNDGTNITFDYSLDGLHWFNVLFENKATFFTTAPDQVGFAANANNSSWDAGIWILSWKETS